MTPTELVAQARELDAKATPGPWHSDGPYYYWDDGASVTPVITAEGRNAIAVVDRFSCNAANDAQLIAEYRTLALELADLVEQLEARVTDQASVTQRLRETLEAIAAYGGGDGGDWVECCVMASAALVGSGD